MGALDSETLISICSIPPTFEESPQAEGAKRGQREFLTLILANTGLQTDKSNQIEGQI